MRQALANILFLTVLVLVCCTPDEPTLDTPVGPSSGASSSVATYYVDDAIGDDNYNGESSTFDGGDVGPWATISYALDQVGTDDTINVAVGTYYEHVTVGKSLTLQGKDRET